MTRPQLAEFMRRMEPDSVAIIPAAREVTRSHDTEYRFRQDSDFYYLTGFREPDAVAVVAPSREKRFTLFVRPRDRRSNFIRRAERDAPDLLARRRVVRDDFADCFSRHACGLSLCDLSRHRFCLARDYRAKVGRFESPGRCSRVSAAPRASVRITRRISYTRIRGD